MDPNTTIRYIREKTLELRTAITGNQIEDIKEQALELIELWEDFDEWRSNGGFPPTDWSKKTL